MQPEFQRSPRVIFSGISVTFQGKVIFWSAVHLLKAELPMAVTDAGMTSSRIPVQLEKA